MAGVISRFTPSLMSRYTLEQVFVARHFLLETVVDRIVEAAANPNRNHTLLVGPRGSGKTHLVALAYHRTTDLISAGHRVQAAWLDEDPWTVVSYGRLLSAIIHTLEPLVTGPLPSRPSVAELESYLAALAWERGPIIVFAENFDQILGELDEAEQQSLRRLLQSEKAMLMVATSTRLDRNLSDQARPFYGFFTTTRLRPLTVDQAQQMLVALARHEGNTQLAEYLEHDQARSRLRIVAHVAGGQPRVWAALSTALTVDGVDDLVDVLLARFDDLTPYYQAQVARLSGHMRLVVSELVETDHPLHVAELAARLNIDPRSMAKTVYDLADRGWVQPASTPLADLLDGRRTYYEVAEPLARLVFQIKQSRGEPVRLVVDFLKGWFDPDDVGRPSTLQAVTYLEMARDGLAYDPVTRIARHLADLPDTPAPALSVLGDVDDALCALTRKDAGPVLRLSAAIRNAVEARLTDPATRAADIVSVRLDLHALALAEVHEHAADVTAWIDRGRHLLTTATTRLDTQAVLVEWLLLDGRLDEAQAVLAAMTAQSDPRHPLLLAARFSLAQQRAILHDTERAIREFEHLVADLDPDSIDSLATRHNIAHWRAQSGDHVGAAEALDELLPDVTRVLGPDHPETLTTRHSLAQFRGEAGEPDQAAQQTAAVTADLCRTLGADHRSTLTARRNHARWLGVAGDPVSAAAGLADLLPDTIRVLGADHPDTLSVRSHLAHWRGESGDIEGAAAATTDLLQMP